MRYNFGTPIETNQLQFAKRTQGSNDEGGASKIEINVAQLSSQRIKDSPNPRNWHRGK